MKRILILSLLCVSGGLFAMNEEAAGPVLENEDIDGHEREFVSKDGVSRARLDDSWQPQYDGENRNFGAFPCLIPGSENILTIMAKVEGAQVHVTRGDGALEVCSDGKIMIVVDSDEATYRGFYVGAGEQIDLDPATVHRMINAANQGGNNSQTEEQSGAQASQQGEEHKQD